MKQTMKRVTPNRSMLLTEKPLLIEKDIQPISQIPKLPLNSTNYCVIDSNDIAVLKEKETRELLHEYSQLQQRIKKINHRLDELRR
jgi:hypothetical protein